MHALASPRARGLGAQVDWDNIIYPTTVLLAQLTDDKAFHDGAQAYFQKWLCRHAAMHPPSAVSAVCPATPLSDVQPWHRQQVPQHPSVLQAACNARPCRVGVVLPDCTNISVSNTQRLAPALWF